ncbi:CBS domain containing protein [Desulfobulbus propionicus DSM 2032]|jgi:nanoRNase/pAp phosphatase (c-di-AMP/oligoRNAs hydrolase)|uniref:CBS domain containing protein n=1 Tax=Desulfobulbus propionicus (strain ATCC 33891 / DSM 2032 / VKM B-1956 / 1pr3) TaxID=577650 RepID=A0A7U3YP74_DESPD|nr:CBS domain-containing protein [Desulfobulbus propionicus]ADW19023.1 CBS domain containing protein [Desulfobulbus propionicus DSM 2032]
MHIATTHRNTDFDGLASIIAATLLYPGTVAVCPKNVNPNVHRFLSLHKTSFDLILAGEVKLEDVTRLIVADTNQWRRLDRVDQLRDRDDVELLLWDHHLGIGDLNPHWQCVEKIGATITLLVREIKAQQIDLTPLQATLFLLGLYEDTGQLTFSSTTPEDARAAAFLLEQGADLNIAVDFLNMAYGEVQKKVLFRLMRDAEQHEIKGKRVGIGVVHISRHVELAMVVQLYAKIVNADAVFVIFVNEGGGFFVIGRSSAPEINVNTILQRFGGGGHPGAGSATITDKQLTAGVIRQKIIAALHEVQRGGALVADMMSFPVTTVPPDAPMHEIRRIMEEEKIRGVVVEEDDRLQGIVVLWDLKKLRLTKQWNSPVKAFMNRKVTTIAPEALASEAADLMVQKNIGHLPVVQGEKVIGIVTRTDVINYLYGMLPS